MGIISRLMEQRNTSTLKDPARWLLEAFGAGMTSSGITVTPYTARKIVAVMCAVRIIAESIASLPLFIYKRKADGKGRDRQTSNPLHAILHNQPNPWQTSFEFIEMMTGHVCLRGNAYAEILYNGRGGIRMLIPRHPDKMRVYDIANANIGDQVLAYEYAPTNGQSRLLLADEVLHLKGISDDGLVGLSPVQEFAEALGLAVGTEKYAGKFFANYGNPGGVLTHPKTLTQEASKRLREQWEAKHTGIENAHRVAVLEEGLTWTAIGVKPQDSQLLESRQFSITEIARMFRVPPHMLADLSRATFCLPASAEVYTETGPRSISQVSVGDRVWSLTSDGAWTLSRVSAAGCSGEDEILRIATTNRTIRLNARHRVLVRKKFAMPRKGQGGYQHIEWRNEWVQAGDLSVGDTMIAAETLPDLGHRKAPNGRELSVGFMEFCGLLLGDGNVSMLHGVPVGVQIARAEHAQYMDHYRKVMQEEFTCSGKGTGARPICLNEGDRQTRFKSRAAGEELAQLGLSGTARTKTIPAWVFGLADDLRLALLRGFLDADGSVDKYGRMSFSSCNGFMLSQLRHLCIGLGIAVTNLRLQEGITVLPNGKKCPVKQYCYTCSDPGQNLRISSHTPVYCERLNAGIPFGRKGRSYPRYGGKGFASSGLSLSRIARIEIEPSEPVYDLTVDGTHSFIADGLVVHNSNIEHQSLEFVMHTLRPWLVRWEKRLGMSLLTDSERASGLFIEFNVDGLLRGDIASRYRAYATGRQWGWLSANDVRQLENLNPREDEGGDAYHEPLNMASSDQADQPENQDDPDKKKQEDV